MADPAPFLARTAARNLHVNAWALGRSRLRAAATGARVAAIATGALPPMKALAAVPSTLRLPLGVALALAMFAADALVYDAEVGLGFALFLAALPVLAGLSAPEPPGGRVWSTTLAIVVAALAPLLMQSNALTVTVALIGTFAAALNVRGVLAGGWTTRLAETLVQLVAAPVRVVPLWRRLGLAAMASSPRASLLVWALPVAFAGVFVWLFAEANPVLERALEALDIAAFLETLFTPRAFFALAMGALAAPFLHPAARKAGWLMAFAASLSMMRGKPDDEAALRRRWSEAGFASRSLLLFNVVFALQTATDVAFLYGGAALPEGMSYAAYAHRGAYPLLATAILAALFVVWTTRPQGPAATSPRVTKMVLLWVAQNVLLLVSSLVRLGAYVDAMGLTYWRVSAGIWMALTGIGFALILVRGVRGLSLGWLVSANVAALAAMLYAASFVDWADRIARSQLARETGLCSAVRYVRGIGAAALPAVRDAARERGRPIELCGNYHGRTRDLERILRGRAHLADWRSLTRRRLALEKIAASPYAVAEPARLERAE